MRAPTAPQAAPEATRQTAPGTASSALRLRDATPADVPEILALIRELALYEKDPDAAIVTAADLLRDGFGPHPYFHCILAEWHGPTIGGVAVPIPSPTPSPVAGFALYFFQYSTWEGRPSLYLEDLFVRERFRQNGIGKALFQRLAQIALDRHCTRLQWECLDWNTPALDFYERTGAVILRDWLNLRMTTAAITRMAESNPNP